MKNRHKNLIGILLAFALLIQCSSKKDQKSSYSDSTPPQLTTAVQLANNSQVVDQEIFQSRQNAITRAIAQVSPAVVGINVVQIRRYVESSPFENDPFWGLFFPQREYLQKVKGLGSGFLISQDGYVLTNEHVIHQASQIVVTTTEGKRYNAAVVGADFKHDVALLKIKGKNFPYISLGNSDDIIIGEWVIALGNPFGLFNVGSKPTVTVGVVSATGMDFKGELAIEGRSYKGMIQTDAPINGGNSGGPLVNSLGQCIGINTLIISGSQYEKTSVGIGFAIPINRVKKLLPDLKKIGHLKKTFQTGLEVTNINWLMARMLGISSRDGVIVTRVARESAAEQAGIQIGDVIVAVNNERIHSTQEFERAVNSANKKESLFLTIFRDGDLYRVVLKF